MTLLFLWWLNHQPLAMQRRCVEATLRALGFSKNRAFDVAKQIRPLSERRNHPGDASNGAPSPGARGD